MDCSYQVSTFDQAFFLSLSSCPVTGVYSPDHYLSNSRAVKQTISDQAMANMLSLSISIRY